MPCHTYKANTAQNLSSTKRLFSVCCAYTFNVILYTPLESQSYVSLGLFRNISRFLAPMASLILNRKSARTSPIAQLHMQY